MKKLNELFFLNQSNAKSSMKEFQEHAEDVKINNKEKSIAALNETVNSICAKETER